MRAPDHTSLHNTPLYVKARTSIQLHTATCICATLCVTVYTCAPLTRCAARRPIALPQPIRATQTARESSLSGIPGDSRPFTPRAGNGPHSANFRIGPTLCPAPAKNVLRIEDTPVYTCNQVYTLVCYGGHCAIMALLRGGGVAREKNIRLKGRQFISGDSPDTHTTLAQPTLPTVATSSRFLRPPAPRPPAPPGPGCSAEQSPGPCSPAPVLSQGL